MQRGREAAARTFDRAGRAQRRPAHARAELLADAPFGEPVDQSTGAGRFKFCRPETGGYAGRKAVIEAQSY